MSKMLLLGDEAVAQAAIDAGITAAYGYPGTPSTEILEYLQRVARKDGAFLATWAANEKVAYEQAMGSHVSSYLKIGVYPIPEQKVQRLLDHVETVMVIEEGYPFIERQLFGLMGRPPRERYQGRLTGHLPPWGELTPDIVAAALQQPRPARARSGGATLECGPAQDLPLANRPPQLCQGCPHRDTYNSIRVIRELFPHTAVFSDIGCYTLGFYSPFEAIDSCLDMGASISMAKGAADAGMHPVLCVIGDSTFGHSGMTPLLTAAHEDTNMVVLIVDNSTVAMTGTQESMSTGERVVQIVAGLGVPSEHVRVVQPLPKNVEENARILQQEIEHKGLSVIIGQRPCLEIKL